MEGEGESPESYKPVDLGIMTERGFLDYVRTFRTQEEELYKLIENKTVVDLGSGSGLFAKDCARYDVPTKVISVNPMLAHKDSKKQINRRAVYTLSVQLRIYLKVN